MIAHGSDGARAFGGTALFGICAGLLLVAVRDRVGPRLARFRRYADFTPLGTAALVRSADPAAVLTLDKTMKTIADVRSSHVTA